MEQEIFTSERKVISAEVTYDKDKNIIKELERTETKDDKGLLTCLTVCDIENPDMKLVITYSNGEIETILGFECIKALEALGDRCPEDLITFNGEYQQCL